MRRIDPLSGAVLEHQQMPPGTAVSGLEADGAEAVARNARIREVGTANLAAAALTAGSRRLIAQSIAWAYAPGSTPHVETDPLDLAAAPPLAVTVLGVAALEHAVLGRLVPEGIVLRYARLYGPGTGANAATDEDLSVHIDAAAFRIDAILPCTFGKIQR